MLLCETKRLSRGDFLMPAEKSGSAGASDFRLPEEGLHFDEVERSLVRQALERAGGNQTQAAALLGMNRDQIRYRIEKFGLGDAKTRRRERSSS